MTAKEHFRTLGRFIVAYWFWIVLLVATNVAVWAGLECAWHRRSPTDLWAVRMDLASGLVLFDNLCVLWWYAHSTWEQKAAAQAQLHFTSKDYIERNKPVVYSDLWEDPEREGAYHYVVRNVGGGFALNVYFLEAGGFPFTIGALAAGTERRLPAILNQELVEARGGASHILVAEGPFSRTTQWTATLNYRTPEQDGRHGQVEHANAIPRVPPPRGENQTLVQYLDNNSRSLFEQLDQVRAQEDVALEKLRGYVRRKHEQTTPPAGDTGAR